MYTKKIKNRFLLIVCQESRVLGGSWIIADHVDGSKFICNPTTAEFGSLSSMMHSTNHEPQKNRIFLVARVVFCNTQSFQTVIFAARK